MTSSDDYLITDVRGQDYAVQKRQSGNGFFFAPCIYTGVHAMYRRETIQEVITAQPICLIDDEQTIRDLISIHVRLEIPIETTNTN